MTEQLIFLNKQNKTKKDKNSIFEAFLT